MKKLSYFFVFIFFYSCSVETEVKVSDSEKLIGTWLLLEGVVIEKGDTVTTDYTIGRKGIKMLNKDNFAFFQHDLSNGKDSVKIYVSGGGTYTLNQNVYTENLEYCNYREYEGHTFEFEVEIKNDTLIQRGVEKVDDIERYIIESYIRIE